jgi:methionyl aminopeptidase
MISIKSASEIAVMRANGKSLARVLEELKKAVKPGLKTIELEKLARRLIEETGSRCSFLDYGGGSTGNKPFPACLCVSINEQIVHGVPGERVLREGDIVSLDLGLFRNGFHADMAVTVAVGRISPAANRLVRVTKKVLKIAVKKARVGNTFGDISNTVQRYAEAQGYGVVRELCGHGIGRELHQEPSILNFGNRGQGAEIKEGMVFCLEPMLTQGDWRIKKGADGFAYVTADNSLSAHFEHMVAIVNGRPEILTLADEVD